MLKSFLVFSLTLPMCGHGQSYADSPFYGPISAIPSSAHAEYTRHGNIKANGVVIDLSAWESVPRPSFFDEIGGYAIQARVDGDIPGSAAQTRGDRTRLAQTFHFYIQYNDLNVTFAYDLLAQPEGTDKIKCTFSAFTDPPYGTRRKDIPVLTLPADLTPLVIKSGGAIAIKTLPLGEGKVEVIHYLRLTRTDLTPASDSAQ